MCTGCHLFKKTNKFWICSFWSQFCNCFKETLPNCVWLVQTSLMRRALKVHSQSTWRCPGFTFKLRLSTHMEAKTWDYLWWTGHVRILPISKIKLQRFQYVPMKGKASDSAFLFLTKEVGVYYKILNLESLSQQPPRVSYWTFLILNVVKCPPCSNTYLLKFVFF